MPAHPRLQALERQEHTLRARQAHFLRHQRALGVRYLWQRWRMRALCDQLLEHFEAGQLFATAALGAQQLPHADPPKPGPKRALTAKFTQVRQRLEQDFLRGVFGLGARSQNVNYPISIGLYLCRKPP